MSEPAASRGRRAAQWLAVLWAAWFVAMAVRGAGRGFSAVPFWDMWPGYLGFQVRLFEGDLGAWWAQHNEHRIVLARLLFWLDLRLFGGGTVFLVAANFALALGAALTFAAIFRAQSRHAGHERLAWGWLVLPVLLFSWVQHDNLAWAFQSQFFLAQWLPLLALYLLARSVSPGPARDRWFAAACLVGVLSIGTMANGVLALPLMTAFALCVRLSARRVAALGVLSAACLAVYFTGYERPGHHHGTLQDLLVRDPADVVAYVLLYLGSPAAHLAGRALPELQLAIALAVGLLVVLLTAWRAAALLRRPQEQPVSLAMLAFIAFVLASALGTAAGRLLNGVDQAVTSRYTTPALMTWLALLAAWLPVLLGWRGWPRAVLAAAMLAVLVPFSAYQTRVHRERDWDLFQRDVAAMAVELRAEDWPQIGHIAWPEARPFELADRLEAHGLTVFSEPWLSGLRQRMGTPGTAVAHRPCAGGNVAPYDVPEERRYLRIGGRMEVGVEPATRSTVELLDAQGRRIGHALLAPAELGAPDPGRRAFLGYVQRWPQAREVRFVHVGTGCSFVLSLPPSLVPFRPVPYLWALRRANASVAQVARNEGFTGSDAEHTEFPGFRVLGSVRTGDADTGRIVLALNRGDALFYRTGEGAKGQTYAVAGAGGRPVFAGELPASPDWRAIEFDSELLPPRFNLTLSDEGRGAGQWSAIGLRDASQP